MNIQEYRHKINDITSQKARLEGQIQESQERLKSFKDTLKSEGIKTTKELDTVIEELKRSLEDAQRDLDAILASCASPQSASGPAAELSDDDFDI